MSLKKATNIEIDAENRKELKNFYFRTHHIIESIAKLYVDFLYMHKELLKNRSEKYFDFLNSIDHKSAHGKRGEIIAQNFCNRMTDALLSLNADLEAFERQSYILTNLKEEMAINGSCSLHKRMGIKEFMEIENIKDANEETLNEHYLKCMELMAVKVINFKEDSFIKMAEVWKDEQFKEYCERVNRLSKPIHDFSYKLLKYIGNTGERIKE